MADNTDGDPLGDPTNTQPDIPSDDLIPTTDKETNHQKLRSSFRGWQMRQVFLEWQCFKLFKTAGINGRQ